MTLLKKYQEPNLTLTNFFDDFLGQGIQSFAQRGQMIPKANVLESAEAFGVELFAPGLKKEDFKITLKDDFLTISAKHTKTEKSEGAGQAIRNEFTISSFNRSFHLSTDIVESDKIEAKYVDGVLKIHIPKKEEAKALPPRTILVQ